MISLGLTLDVTLNFESPCLTTPSDAVKGQDEKQKFSIMFVLLGLQSKVQSGHHIL